MSTRLLEKLQPVFSSHSGREKMVRIIQYWLMFLIPTMINMKKSRPVKQAVQHAITDGKTAVPQVEEMTVRLVYIKGNMSLTRKVMRFGIPLNLLLGMIGGANSPSSYVLNLHMSLFQLVTMALNSSSMSDSLCSKYWVMIANS